MSGLLDRSIVARYERLQREIEFREEQAQRQADYEQRERARAEAAARRCAGCGHRDSLWPGCPHIGADDRPVLQGSTT